ncbi:MAG: hypothetical protein CMF62_02120 [Magnetococcales bacterium]|nr:hypothetical protein [Magnetococcales bacterium]|tara:strand:- start:160448 stop:162478 length:2031 start_codon:yes stop_codon:yes gene_type:complete
MLKYFYYLWNLLKGNEKIQLFHHFGQCLLSAVLYTIIDWQHLILIWILSQLDTTNVVWSVIGTQFFVWGISLWYYYLKYKIMKSQNFFFKILSGRHYQYILKRLSKNASYTYLNEKSSNELAKQLDSTDKGLQHILSFLSLVVKLLATIGMSLFVISYNYQICAILFVIYAATSYYITTRKMVYKDSQVKKVFTYINQESSLIISDNISLLLDATLHNDYEKLINNILNYNEKTKKKQIWLYSEQDKMNTKIGLGLITGYVLTLIMISLSMRFQFEQFTIFFIASLLTYKCLSNNINQLLDKYSDIRQSQLDFESLDDIWIETSKTRIDYNKIILPKSKLCIDEWIEYRKEVYDIYDKSELDYFDQIIRTKHYEKEFNEFLKKQRTLSFKKNSYTDRMYLLEMMKRFVYSNTNLFNLVKLKKQENTIYLNHVKSSKINFTMKLIGLHFEYPSNDITYPFSITYKDKLPYVINSNDNILISGSSGSGKTTLLKIFRGILPVECSFDAKKNYANLELKYRNETKYLSFTNIAHDISYSQQNSYSFTSGNIYQIITGDYVSKNYESVQTIIFKALDIACVETKFRDLEYCITKNNISGGQRQRLTIAKNIYRLMIEDKSIVILDEIDQGIDLETAKKILLNLLVLLKNKLVFVVSHSEELKKLFNKKLEMKNGSIQKYP